MGWTITIIKMSTAIVKRDYTVGIFMDFSKAFDTINHGTLLDKLQSYGIALDWFKSCWSDRMQKVKYNDIVSGPKKGCCGVPQGSVLGPL